MDFLYVGLMLVIFVLVYALANGYEKLQAPK